MGGPGAVLLLLAAAGAPRRETQARLVTSSRVDGLYQPRFSPNGRWIVFEAVKGSETTGVGGANATLYVTSVSGGPWVRITDGNSWDDKPRWSADGKTIYYISSRTGLLNVWSIRFHPVEGRVLGVPFQVTRFESPALMIANSNMALLGMSVAGNRLVLSMAEASGSIWMLENMEH